MAESGLVNYWIKRITPKNEICKVENRKVFYRGQRDDSQRKILALYDLSGPFILLIMGSMLSLFVFLLEKIYYYYNLINNLSFPPPVEVRDIGPSLANTDQNIGIIDKLSVDYDKQGASLDETEFLETLENSPATVGADSQLNVEELEMDEGKGEVISELTYTIRVK